MEISRKLNPSKDYLGPKASLKKWRMWDYGFLVSQTQPKYKANSQGNHLTDPKLFI